MNLLGLKHYEKEFPMAKTLREKIQISFVKTVYNNYIKKKDGGIYETFHPFTGKGIKNQVV